jgi:RNA polymerase sigma factor (sigma-70 family)
VRGGEEEFAAYVREHWHATVRAAQAIARCEPHEAEDLAQVALTRLAQRWERVDEPAAYLRRILARLAVDSSRSRSRRPPTGPLDGEIGLPPAPDHAVDIAEAERLAAALASLPHRQQQVLALRYLHDRTEAETASVLGVTTGAVKRYAHLGLRRLRDLPDL